MAIGTGAVSMSDIRTEWGRSGTIKMSEMYRGGSHIPTKSANNTGANGAPNVPTSGTIAMDNFRGSKKAFVYTFSATATNQTASTLFGDDYADTYPKEIVINSGVEIGATATNDHALDIDTGNGGTITVTNNGTISGAGGAAGSDGGDALKAAVNVTVINNGTIRAGGGGGGTGGAGQRLRHHLHQAQTTAHLAAQAQLRLVLVNIWISLFAIIRGLTQEQVGPVRLVQALCL